MGLPLRMSRDFKPEHYKGFVIYIFYRVDTYGGFYDWAVYKKGAKQYGPSYDSGKINLKFGDRITKKQVLEQIKKKL